MTTIQFLKIPQNASAYFQISVDDGWQSDVPSKVVSPFNGTNFQILHSMMPTQWITGKAFSDNDRNLSLNDDPAVIMIGSGIFGSDSELRGALIGVEIDDDNGSVDAVDLKWSIKMNVSVTADCFNVSDPNSAETTSGIVNGEYCSDAILISNEECDPYLEPEGSVCANQGKWDEAYCSYNISDKMNSSDSACAFCPEYSFTTYDTFCSVYSLTLHDDDGDDDLVFGGPYYLLFGLWNKTTNSW